jgi:ribonuclease P protein component
VTELSQGFPPQSRLKKAAEFKKVFTNPVKSTDRYFTLLATQNDFGHPRLGLAIAKKMIKKAVDRNTIKRTVRESFRLQQHTMGSIDIVVLARKEALDAPPDELRKSLEKHWLKLVSKCATC